MATVNPTGTNDVLNNLFTDYGSTTNKTDASVMQEASDRFLTMLVTQLKNQDPLNPLDNAEVTSQLAQINTVTGIEKLNATLSSLLDGYGESQAMQAANMIGRTVLIAGDTMQLTDNGALGGIKLDGPADQVLVSVLDASGATVYSDNLGAYSDPGSFAFFWDGTTNAGEKAPNGAYTIRVTATQGDQSVPVTGMQAGMVNAVVRDKTGFLLDLGSLGKVSFANVQQIL
ncbi:MAG: flagellar hook assembly protein FlgD [Betaproteobacteria bacterium]|nr:flagellar hook assembly protein FlgD [Betaproteobacteria bacterium]